MNTGRLRLGLLSILLSVIVICMSVLSLLSFATSMADMRLAQRYARTVEIRYQLEKQGRQLIQQQGAVNTEIELEGYRLIIESDENGEIKTWCIEKIWQQDERIDDLWEG